MHISIWMLLSKLNTKFPDLAGKRFFLKAAIAASQLCITNAVMSLSLVLSKYTKISIRNSTSEQLFQNRQQKDDIDRSMKFK